MTQDEFNTILKFVTGLYIRGTITADEFKDEIRYLQVEAGL